MYDIDPWGEERKDMRSAVSGQLPWAERGALTVFYPYVPSDTTELSEEDELEAIAQIEAIRAKEEQVDGTA